MTSDTDPRIRAALDARAAAVASWLADRFAECPAWPAHELRSLAEAAGYDLLTWWEAAPVRALRIRKPTVEVTPGNPAIVWTVIPEDDETNGDDRS